jgi:hypothetical protein
MDRVRVGYRDYEITTITTPVAETAQVLGFCHKDAALIGIEKDLPIQRDANVRLHEVLHAIWKEYALTDDDEEERIITVFANGLCSLMRDNPGWLAEIEEKMLGDAKT